MTYVYNDHIFIYRRQKSYRDKSVRSDLGCNATTLATPRRAHLDVLSPSPVPLDYPLILSAIGIPFRTCVVPQHRPNETSSLRS